ncbi:serine/threonine protein kinase [Helicocarpus griseus UAMH5409]|uniref:Serine/threonine protein kinase n=1 Tax=Helicocarpus griseus UAMH5409 TaxID=1447875 RepID=A0A2B7XRW3_9EURO|nr:serine/threonine protein kinase [Helicocarpus griseus UAMH5409]
MSSREPPIPLVLKTSVNPSASHLSPLSPSSTLTPPLTPTTPNDKPESCSGQNAPKHFIPALMVSDEGGIEGVQAGLQKNNALPREFTYDLELQMDSGGNAIEYGRGAWSVVYSATSRWISTTPDCPPTPPPCAPASCPTSVLAVKSPIRRDAHSILRAEARLLTRLSNIPGAEHHIVPFHGFISSSHALVLSALPLSLSAYITSQAVSARQVFSTKTMFDPVLGMPRWLSLAKKLVAGLEWLHSCGQIVHGDIKPQNILLRPREPANDSAEEDPFPYDPLYVDFTSSYDPSTLEPCAQGQGPSLSALTPPFAAPELLTVKSLKSTDLVQSKGSDVFSLAVTLLAAVTGDLLLYPGSSNMQRLAMSKEGHLVLDYVRSGVHGSRLPVRGVAEKILAPAVVKDPEGRIKPADWLRLINESISSGGLKK